MSGPNDDRPPTVVAMQWASQVVSISVAMLLPVFGGYWLDIRWGTSPWLVIVGTVLGFSMGMYYLMKLVAASNRATSKKR